MQKGARIVVLAVSLIVLSTGCRDQNSRPDRFELAETHHRRGEYAAALEDYQAFLDQYPKSPLADTARRRVRSINRLVRSTLNGETTPAPSYVGGRADRTGASSAAEATARSGSGADAGRPVDAAGTGSRGAASE
ncbi:MAG: tol-pal system YbgF family protein [Bradymonadaceae bacterium]